MEDRRLKVNPFTLFPPVRWDLEYTWSEMTRSALASKEFARGCCVSGSVIDTFVPLIVVLEAG